MFVLTDTNNVVIVITNNCRQISAGFIIADDCSYADNGITMHEVDSVPDTVIPQYSCYTVEDGFYKNPAYNVNYHGNVLDMNKIEINKTLITIC